MTTELTPINVNLFSFHKESNTLSADESDLHAHGVDRQPIMLVKSFKTGNEIPFIFIRKEYNIDCEVTHWVYLAVHPETRVVDANAPVKHLIIWND